MVELGIGLQSLEKFSSFASLVPDNCETWERIPARLPSLRCLEICRPSSNRLIDERVFTEVLPNAFPNLRTIDIFSFTPWTSGVSLEACLVMAMEVLKRHPAGRVSISCGHLQGVATPVTSSLWDALSMMPSCSVNENPQVVGQLVDRAFFKLQRELPTL